MPYFRIVDLKPVTVFDDAVYLPYNTFHLLDQGSFQLFIILLEALSFCLYCS